MKKLLKTFLILFIILLAPVFASCDANPFNPSDDDGGKGLYYQIDYDEDDNPYLVVAGVGDFTEENLDIPQSVYCKELGVELPVGAIGVGAFDRCKTLKSVTVPESVKVIKGSAFSGCSKLKNISLPCSVKEIGPGAFINCLVLESITIPNSVETLGASAFEGCKGLSDITLSNSISILEYGLFRWC